MDRRGGEDIRGKREIELSEVERRELEEREAEREGKREKRERINVSPLLLIPFHRWLCQNSVVP